MQILTWEIGTQLFAMDVRRCREVVRYERITPVPRARSMILGIVNLRGDVVTVLDLNHMLGRATAADRTREETGIIIRLKGENTDRALRVDRVCDVLEMDERALESRPASLSESEARLISAMAMTESGVVVLLDAREILKFAA